MDICKNLLPLKCPHSLCMNLKVPFPIPDDLYLLFYSAVVVFEHFLQSLYVLFKNFRGRETLKHIFKSLHKINLWNIHLAHFGPMGIRFFGLGRADFMMVIWAKMGHWTGP